MTQIPTILSGIQPTGHLHLGNYLGAIRNWVKLQKDYACYFMLADLHAITVPQDPAALTAATREVAAAFIASGIDTQTCAIFVQSTVTAHAELAWILNCHTPLGWLNRMTQFKEKAGKEKENAALGLYAYPVLMAADILAYRSTHVPVGEDQKQHLELARDIAAAFNRAYGVEYFPLPEPLILGHAARVMSLRDGTKKMSKSDPSDYSRINLTDDADAIALKIRKAKSDMHPDLATDLENRPEAKNLLTIFCALSDRGIEDVLAEYGDKGFSAFKGALADLAVSVLSPITAEMRRLLADPSHIDAILREGRDRAAAATRPLLAEVKRIVGFVQL